MKNKKLLINPLDVFDVNDYGNPESEIPAYYILEDIGTWYWAYSPDDDILYQVFKSDGDYRSIECRVREYL